MKPSSQLQQEHNVTVKKNILDPMSKNGAEELSTKMWLTALGEGSSRTCWELNRNQNCTPAAQHPLG